MKLGLSPPARKRAPRQTSLRRRGLSASPREKSVSVGALTRNTRRVPRHLLWRLGKVVAVLLSVLCLCSTGQRGCLLSQPRFSGL